MWGQRIEGTGIREGWGWKEADRDEDLKEETGDLRSWVVLRRKGGGGGGRKRREKTETNYQSTKKARKKTKVINEAKEP